MDSGYQLKRENPKEKTNFLSKIFFAWMVKLYYQGNKNRLMISDLYKTIEKDKSEKLGDLLEKYWEEEINKRKTKSKHPRLIMALFKAFGKHFIFWGLMMFVQTVVLKSIQPLVLSYLIKLFVTPDEEYLAKKMYISGGLLIGISFLTVLMTQHQNINFGFNGMRIRVAVSSLVYRKLTRLNQNSLGQTTAGHIVNLLSNDVSRFDFVVLFLHGLWILPFQVLLISYFLWNSVGISSLAGILSMIIFTLPLQGYLGKITGKLRFKIAKKTDIRVGIMNEIISGIQVIKMYAWEKPFENIVKLARANELIDITKTSYVRGILVSFMVFIERLTLFFTIICYVLLGEIITADIVFSLAQFFNTLQLAMAIFYPTAIAYGAEALVSIRRIEDFLLLEEKETTNIETNDTNEINLQGVNASWNDTPVLQDIDVKIPAGSLCAVVGPVGSGKSSLLEILIGELPFTSGTISLGGNVAYASQEPWLFQSTVRNNILFGQCYNRQKYKTTIKVCALEKDFLLFPLGDQTVVGERGVSLSGGQRARINLARAVYREADIYLLDDPLSAVDTHVGKHLFEECIVGFLKGKTRLIVTHQLQYLKKADIILVLNQEGKLEAKGNFDDIIAQDLDFTNLLKTASETEDKKETSGYDLESTNNLSLLITNSVRKLSLLSEKSMSLSEKMYEKQEDTQNEERTSSDPNIFPIWEYCKATGNICLILILLMSFFLAQAACAGADYWVAFWTDQEQMRHLNDLQSNEIIQNRDIFSEIKINGTSYNILSTDFSMYIYGGLISMGVFLTIGRSLLFFKMAMMASKNLHSKMFHCLLQVPMRFFDLNPSGRILNRFSKDMGTVDEFLPRVILDALQILLVMLGILVNVSASNPYSIIAIICFGILFYKMRKWYVVTAKNIKYIEGATKSPVFSHVNSTLNGLTSIRASKAEEILISEFDHHQNVHTSAWYLTLSCNVSFGLWLDLVCVIFVALVTFSFIMLRDYTTVSGSLVGLAISQSLILTSMLQHGTRQSAEVVNQMTSVERVLEYTTIAPEEKFDTPKENLPTKDWPNKGRITFDNVSLKYIATDPPVLNDLNFEILPGEKIGIVGRTGAGKSSLIAALFRLAPLEGSIYIDGINTTTLGLTYLRKRISIIPQEPVLFSATIRYNLDPFNEFQDDELWRALEEVELKETIDSLNYMVAEGGGNFSVGQRQLICLARALLRNNKILVMDEATANVDRRTDIFIQSTIRKKFIDCTVLTIAHRLYTIMDSDRIVVMESGRMVEFDHPYKLLLNPDGYFLKMVNETGSSMAQQLNNIALEAYNQNKQVNHDT